MRVLIVFIVMWLTAGLSRSLAADRAELWRSVDAAMDQKLPRTAITNLNLILTGALRDKAFAEAAKAIVRKIVLESSIQGIRLEPRIILLESELPNVPKEIKPLLETVLAHWYWQYYRQNRWRFLNRSTTASSPGPEFATWDLPRLFAHIDSLFTNALRESSALKKIPIAQFDEFFENGASQSAPNAKYGTRAARSSELTGSRMPDRYRPTLFDFIVQEALRFYSADEQAGTMPEDAFEINSSSPVFGDAEAFLKWNPVPPATDHRAGEARVPSLLFRTIKLYQDLIAFHEKDADPSAFLDVNLARLVWAKNVAVGEDKTARYQAALSRFVDRWADHEVSALALYHWAQSVKEDGDWVQARRLALRGAQAHRDSVGGKLCYNLVAEIEAPSCSIQSEAVWKAPISKITVHYRNVTNLFFRVIPYDWESYVLKANRQQRDPSSQIRELIQRATPTKIWTQPLTPTDDFQNHEGKFDVPADLKPGCYLVAVSHNAFFNDQNNQVSFATFWVSDLALVLRPRAGLIEGFVLDSITGEPISDATVAIWMQDDGGWSPLPEITADTNGFFAATASRQASCLVRVNARGQSLALQDGIWPATRESPAKTETRVVFFTDRSLYRPGQSIHYKGLCLRLNTESDQYSVCPGQKVRVGLADLHGKAIAHAEQVCNDYGSFHGVFTAPRDRLLGQMSIYSLDMPGDIRISVEEYKRPKFQVALELPKAAPRLNDQVKVIGKAEAYTGAPIDGAQVKWRVAREVRWPAWWRWASRRLRSSPSQEISHGITRTGADGAFELTFIAKPDPKVSEKEEACFHYSVYADVTDAAGETRSTEETVRVGFVALRAEMSVDEWQTSNKPVLLRIATTTLDNAPQSAEGIVRIHHLKQPSQVQPPELPRPYRRGPYSSWGEDEQPDLSDPWSWEIGDVAIEKGFNTDASGNISLSIPLAVGSYRALLETQDRFGKKAAAQCQIQVIEPSMSKFGIRIPFMFQAPTWTAEPGDEFVAVWATGYESGRAFIEIEHRQQMIERFWTQPGRTQQQLKHAVTEAMRGGFTVHVTQVRNNRAHLESKRVEVPWSNKQLDLKWEHWTSKLQPGQKETWTLAVSKHKSHRNDPSNIKDGTPELAAAELVAALYDHSLDQFKPHAWPELLDVFRRDYSTAYSRFGNVSVMVNPIYGNFDTKYEQVAIIYREFPNDVSEGMQYFRYRMGSAGGARMFDAEAVQAPRMALNSDEASVAKSMARPAPGQTEVAQTATGPSRGGASKSDSSTRQAKSDSSALDQVSARKNLNETAFFFPQLLADSNGVVRLQFTVPEALTTWRLLGFAHDRDLRSGSIEAKAISSKDIMVQPNPPRFLREGDELEFAVKVSNQSDARQQGTIRLNFLNAFDEQPLDELLRNNRRELPFDLPARQSRSYSWRIRIPDGTPFLVYRAVAAAGTLSDGEEGHLPVLPRRQLVTESLILPIRGPATNRFVMTKLAEAGKSDTLRHQSLAVQMVSNPAWYAVLALPYLMEYPHECCEQTFNRIYANTLARHIANSDPKIKRLFSLWKNTATLDGPLDKNQDLKSIMIDETPWLRQSQQENQARKNIGLLFDDNHLESELETALNKLKQSQLADGSWPWFPGGKGDNYITLYIMAGFGRLRHLGVDMRVDLAIRALSRMDEWINQRYLDQLKSPDPENCVPTSVEAMYLYARSFFLKDKPVSQSHKDAIEFFLKQAWKHWGKVTDRQSQGHLALALKRWGGGQNLAVAQAILRSLKECSVTNPELGMFWRDTESSWWWYRAPIETQALMIEAFDEVTSDLAAVEECRVWLLKQKQTQDWKTSKATADAVYALLLRGRNFLANDRLVEVSLGGQDVTPSTNPKKILKMDPSASQKRQTQSITDQIPQSIEPGTGFYERRFAIDSISPKLADITVRKPDSGVAWGSIHWQYLEDIRKITPYQGTPLKLQKSLFRKVNRAQGPVLEPVKGALSVGDELVVRLEIRVDRDLEYVHMKDQRGSGIEPVNVLSQYKYQDGLAYYESTRDTASHFFISYLPKGVFVFEYATRVQHRGEYQSGLASIQCMYAPEFNSHSESTALRVK